MTTTGPAGLPAAVRLRAVPAVAASRRPVVAATLVALLLHTVWALLLARDAGDLAAQYAWTDFASRHPASAYNLSWYGGMHTASYSLLAPYLMGWLGVRTAGVLAGTLSAALAARLLVRPEIPRPLLPALWTAVALWCNVASGRVTFAIGVAFGLAALVAAFPAERPSAPVRPVVRASVRASDGPSARPPVRPPALLGPAVLAALATAGSPLVGLFLGVVAAAVALAGRRRQAGALAAGPGLVLAGTALLFPFQGVQPFDWYVALPVVASAVAVVPLLPREWRVVRGGAAVYAGGAALTWLVPSPVGSNVERLALLFGGTVLLAVAVRPGAAGHRRAPVGAAFLAVACWQVVTPVGDLAVSVPVSATARDAGRLIDELHRVGADRGRVEAVPLRSHLEASGLAPYVNLARGWNRQADVARNPLFYTAALAPEEYHAWLRHWGVGYVVLSADVPDDAAVDEAAIVGSAPSWLAPVWRDEHWRLFRVTDAAPLADPPATVLRAGPAALTVDVAVAGAVLLRVPWSPWLAVEGPPGAGRGCLVEAGADGWTLLRAPGPGTYRVEGRYALPRGGRCPV